MRAEVIRVVKTNLIKVRSHIPPERRLARFVEMPAHFSADAFAKASWKLRQEHETGFGQQRAIAINARRWFQKQRTQLTVAGQIVRHVQQAHARPDVHLAAGVHDCTHAIVIERLGQANGDF